MMRFALLVRGSMLAERIRYIHGSASRIDGLEVGTEWKPTSASGNIFFTTGLFLDLS